VTQGDDPVSLALKGLVDNAAEQEHQIALLWQAIEKLAASQRPDCVPSEAHKTEQFDAEKLSQLVK
jgi:serine O-acetyltransferase